MLRGLAPTGLKAALVARLQAAVLRAAKDGKDGVLGDAPLEEVAMEDEQTIGTPVGSVIDDMSDRTIQVDDDAISTDVSLAIHRDSTPARSRAGSLSFDVVGATVDMAESPELVAGNVKRSTEALDGGNDAKRIKVLRESDEPEKDQIRRSRQRIAVSMCGTVQSDIQGDAAEDTRTEAIGEVSTGEPIDTIALDDPTIPPVTTSIYISNLARPFILAQLRDLLEEFGVLSFLWLDSIKSHAYASVSRSPIDSAPDASNLTLYLYPQYESTASSEAATSALSGQIWPAVTGKLLQVVYVPPERVEVLVAEEQVIFARGCRRIQLDYRQFNGEWTFELSSISTGHSGASRGSTSQPPAQQVNTMQPSVISSRPNPIQQHHIHSHHQSSPNTSILGTHPLQSRTALPLATDPSTRFAPLPGFRFAAVPIRQPPSDTPSGPRLPDRRSKPTYPIQFHKTATQPRLFYSEASPQCHTRMQTAVAAGEDGMPQEK